MYLLNLYSTNLYSTKFYYKCYIVINYMVYIIMYIQYKVYYVRVKKHIALKKGDPQKAHKILVQEIEVVPQKVLRQKRGLPFSTRVPFLTCILFFALFFWAIIFLIHFY